MKRLLLFIIPLCISLIGRGQCIGDGIFNYYNQNISGVDSSSVELSDFDNDGDLDAFVTYYSTQSDKVWLNDGLGNFSNSAQNLGTTYSSDVSLGDLDSDGDIDAFVTNGWNQGNKIWLNDGLGNFSNSGQSLTDSYCNSVELADLNGDGFLDAFVARGTKGSNFPNVVYLNDGNGNFTNSGQNLGNSKTLDVKLADLDNDGDVDAFTANYLQNNKVWYNDGNGNFTDSGLGYGTTYSMGLSLGDLDGDGDIDAFEVNYYAQSNIIWINNGIGVFSNSGQSLGNSYSKDVVLADFDSDGDIDAFVANNNSQANKIWLNDGLGNFSNSGQSLGNSNSISLSKGNLDADGDVDVIVYNQYQNCKVWLNDANPILHQFSDTSCFGYNWNNQTYNSSGSYIQTLSTVEGCDSIVTLDLTIKSPSSNLSIVGDSLFCEEDIITLTASNIYGGNYTWDNGIVNGQSFIQSPGSVQYNVTNTDTNGCISNSSINVVVYDTLTYYLNETACDSYTSPSGTVYTSSGVYNDYVNVLQPSGHICDDLYVIDLTILNSTSSTINDVFCNNYLLNGQTYTVPGTYNQTITNAAGCDSIITLNLSFNSSSSTITTTACGSYTLNGQAYTSSGTYSQVTTNLAGCDSTITLNLTINNNQYPIAFQANPTAGTTPLSVIFDNQTANLSNYNFTWSFGDGTVVQDNGSFVSHTYQSNGTWDVILIAEDVVTGCTDTLFKNGYIFSTGGTPCGHTATINQTGPITACLSDSVFLSCNADPNFTYQWQLNGFPIGGATDPIFYPTQSGSYVVIITDNNCPEYSSTIQVTINTLNAPTISGSGTINSCTGGSVTLSVPDDYVSYLWSSGGTDTSEVVTSSGDYTVTVTDNTGCQATSSIYSVNASLIPTQEICIVTVDSTSTHNLVVWEKPVISGIDSFIVYREMGTNNYMPIGSVAYDSLSQFVDTTNGINPNVTSYRYKLSVLDTCGTESNLSYHHETMHLSTNQGVGGEVNLIWDEYEGFPILYYYILRDSTSNGNWEVLDSVSSNNFIYTDLNPPTIGTNYLIEAIPPSTCTSTKAIDHNSTRSNKGTVSGGGGGQSIFQHLNSKVNVFPNPTNDLITLDINGYNGTIETQVYDLSGRLLETTNSTTINLKDYAKGIYVFRVAYGDRVEELKVVKD